VYSPPNNAQTFEIRVHQRKSKENDWRSSLIMTPQWGLRVVFRKSAGNPEGPNHIYVSNSAKETKLIISHERDT